MSGLSLRSDEPEPDDDPPAGDPAPRTRGRGLLAAVILLTAGCAGLGYLAYRLTNRVGALEANVRALGARVDQSAALAQQARERAVASETAARAAAEGRQVAEVQTADARLQADAARLEAATAQETAARARTEADAIRKQAEAEMNRLESALGEVAETRRTALGLVMNLGSDYLKFEFNKAELRAEDRELLSRISGILLTARDYTVSVIGHTDDVGSAAYNQKLSERRAQAVRDYLVGSGLPATIFSVEGHGKSRPLEPGASDKARAKNRRVELGIVNTQIKYLRGRRTF